jgi:aspartate racemase
MPVIEPILQEVTWNPNELAIGIVGVAPWATLSFCSELYKLVDAKKDWHYPRLIIDANTKIPSRGRYFDLGETDPSPYIKKTILELQNAGAGVIVVPCNTAHIFYHSWAEGISTPVPHIIDSTVLRATKIGSGTVSVLESLSMRRFGLYKQSIEDAGNTYISLTDKQAKLVSGLISTVKVEGEPSKQDGEKFETLLLALKRQGTDTLILGCTELSIFTSYINRHSLQVIDSNIELARAALLIAGCDMIAYE